jgi:hypothetical protein
MNLFRSEEHIARWLGTRTPGATIPAQTLCDLALRLVGYPPAPGLATTRTRGEPSDPRPAWPSRAVLDAPMGFVLYDLRAVARPPFRPAAFSGPSCRPASSSTGSSRSGTSCRRGSTRPASWRSWAALSLDMPLSLSASYCFSFLTFALFWAREADTRLGCAKIKARCARPRRRSPAGPAGCVLPPHSRESEPRRVCGPGPCQA